MNLLLQYVLALSTTSVVLFIVAIFVFTRNPKNKVNQTFSLYSLSIAVWSACEAYSINAPTKLLGLWAWRLNHMGVIFIPIFFVHFIYSILEVPPQNRKILKVLYGIGCCLAVMNLTNLLIADVVPKFSFKYMVVPGSLYLPFVIWWGVTITYGLVKLHMAFVKSKGTRRNQLRYLWIGSIIGYLGGPLNFLPAFNIEIFPIMPFGTYAVPFYSAILTYAIVKYRLMDITLAVTRTAILLILYGIIFSVSIVLSTVFRAELMQIAGENWWLIPVIIYTIAITLAPFLYIKLQKRAEARILKNQRHHHAIIMTAARNISLVRDLDKVLRLLAIILTKTLSITYAGVYLLDRTKKQFCLRVSRGGKNSDAAIDLGNSLVKYLQGARKALVYEEIRREYEDRRDIFIKEIRDAMIKINADLLVPSFIEDELVGFLALGPKKLGEVYTVEDINVLTSLANQSALAIENAQFLKEREDMQGKLREAETLTTIRDLLGSFNHELYNLLTPISGTLQGLNMGLYEKKPERLKSDVEKSITTTFFIKTYLGWVREYVESGDKVAAYQLSELINSGLSYSNDKIEKQNIKTQVNVSPKIFVVGYECLPLLFKHLIMHSIYGYGMENGGTIDISARMLEDKSTVEIIQTDTGDDLTKYIKEGSTMGGKKFAEKGKLGGTSYFIAQAVVSKHKGSFEVETTGGKGTKFRIRLPLDFNRPAA